MFHYLDNIYDNFTHKDKYVFIGSTIVGWFVGIHFFNPMWLSWGPILSGLMSIIIASVTAFAGALTLDLYKLKVKPRLFKKELKKTNKKVA